MRSPSVPRLFTCALAFAARNPAAANLLSDGAFASTAAVWTTENPVVTSVAR